MEFQKLFFDSRFLKKYDLLPEIPLAVSSSIPDCLLSSSFASSHTDEVVAGKIGRLLSGLSLFLKEMWKKNFDF